MERPSLSGTTPLILVYLAQGRCAALQRRLPGRARCPCAQRAPPVPPPPAAPRPALTGAASTEGGRKRSRAEGGGEQGPSEHCQLGPECPGDSEMIFQASNRL